MRKAQAGRVQNDWKKFPIIWTPLESKCACWLALGSPKALASPRSSSVARVHLVALALASRRELTGPVSGSPESESGFPEKKSGFPDSPTVRGHEIQARCRLSWVGSGRARTGAACVGGQILTGKNFFLTGKNRYPALGAIRSPARWRCLISPGPDGGGFGLLAVHARRRKVYVHRILWRAANFPCPRWWSLPDGVRVPLCPAVDRSSFYPSRMFFYAGRIPYCRCW